MSFRTLEVELDNGRIRPCGTEELPAKGHALLTLLDSDAATAAARTCGELAERWNALDKLPPGEAMALAADIEQSRASLPPVKSAWDQSSTVRC